METSKKKVAKQRDGDSGTKSRGRGTGLAGVGEEKTERSSKAINHEDITAERVTTDEKPRYCRTMGHSYFISRTGV